MRRIHLYGLLLLSLAVRLPLLLSQHDAYITGGIATSLGLVARNILEGRGLVETTGPSEILQLYEAQVGRGKLLDIRDFPDPPDQPTKPLIQRMPGYPLLLASIWKLTGNYRYFPLQTLQVLLSALLPFLLLDTGRRLLGERAGLVAGVLSALNLPEARLAVAPLYDWWIVLLASCLAWLLVRSQERGYPPGDFLAMGLMVAAAAYLKSTVIVLPLFATAALLPSLPLRPLALRLALAFGLPILALVPWAARNHRIFGRPILTNTFFWATLWEGFGEVPNRFGAVLDDRLTYVHAVGVRNELVYGTPEYDDFFRPKVVEVFNNDPGFVASLWIRRLVRGLLFPVNVWGIPWAENPESSFTYFQGTQGGGPLAYLAARPGTVLVKAAQRIWEPLLFLLALLALLTDRRRWREFLPLVALPVSLLAATIPLHLEGRYLLPATQIWILFAAVPLAAWLLPEARGARPAAPVGDAPA
jgi:4-amino-4-deoxy-L-arabinose transferase-like glycosyltransferase